MATFAFVLPLAAQNDSLPRVRMIIDDYDYMISLFPDDYPIRDSALAACATIAPQAESLKAFWDMQGLAVLDRLSLYAGIEWTEPQFDIYIVKYYPDYAAYDPMTIPLAGKKNGDRIIAVPQDLSHLLALFQQLSRRLLNQAFIPGTGAGYLADHPLMQKTPRRFDALADLLALTTLADFVDRDSVMAVYRSDPWKLRAPGRDVVLNHLWKRWPLSSDSPLADRIAAEPVRSDLVALTRPPEQIRPRRVGLSRIIGQPPAESRLGFSVTEDRPGLYRVTGIDSLKSAYSAGLRRGDLIRNVDGRTPRDIKDLYTLILDHTGQGVYVSYLRGDRSGEAILYPEP
ncbi:MAG: hypothetical protein PHR28_03225 [candidate division Zixibacteria bacterium]|nr:hypothetical protein [candidate division Zixibacteria bacterium]